MNESLGQRIKRYRKIANLSQAALAKACGWDSQSRVGNYEKDTREPSLGDIELMAKALGIHSVDLLVNSVDANSESFRSSQPPIDNNVEMALQPTRSFLYPEISWVQAGSAREVMEAGNVALCPQHSSDVWAGEDAFWLRVVGSSMSSSNGTSFPEGFLILVAPDIEPRPGQFVVARMIDSNEATFKQLVRDAGDLYLKPLNSSYPTRPVDDTWEIVGTVVDGKMPKSVFMV